MGYLACVSRLSPVLLALRHTIPIGTGWQGGMVCMCDVDVQTARRVWAGRVIGTDGFHTSPSSATEMVSKDEDVSIVPVEVTMMAIPLSAFLIDFTSSNGTNSRVPFCVKYSIRFFMSPTSSCLMLRYVARCHDMWLRH